MLQPDFESAGYGPRRLSVELTNICNLHCSYCLRDDDALYHTTAKFFAPELLESIVRQAREAIGITHLNFTGGEPTLHPRFDEILTIAESNNLKVSFVTNGWNFEKIWPKLLTHRSAVTHVAFSIDGATRELHDKWRGEGSFVRLVRAFSRCFAGELPFMLKVVIRRDTLPQLEQLALFAARMGAAALHFAHVTPTSADVANTSALNLDERSQAEKEIAILSRIFKMKIGIDVGYQNLDPAPPCSALIGVSANVDYRGRLSLCCNLSGYRSGIGEEDVAGDLNQEDFASAYAALSKVAAAKLIARANHLHDVATHNLPLDLYTASPCLFCLDTMGKLPWRQAATTDAATPRALPVLGAI
ncbi:MAG TPA: radical SAM protein [Pyrinomonadaceae bacterium]|nr:radical SAM protein [Pyrinomonadaceae bacterium]